MADFDTITKHLIEARPRDWVALAGMPIGRTARPVDTDLSKVKPLPDKLIRVAGASGGPYLAHVEFQASPDVTLDRRVMVYNVLAGWRHRLPVRSVAFLLRPKAAPSAVRGQVRDAAGEHTRLSFDYQLVRVWELPVAGLLTGGLGTLPLATIAAVSLGDLPAILAHIGDRIEREVPESEAGEVWFTTKVMMGLRYDRPEVTSLLKGVRNMKESWVVQDILKEGRKAGRVEGRVEGERALLLQQGTRRFGAPPATALKRLNTIDDADELLQLGVKLFDATSWQDWLRAPGSRVTKRRARSGT